MINPFLVLGVEFLSKLLPSMLVHDGQFGRRENPCSSCLFDSHAPEYRYLVQGFSDFHAISETESGFLAPGPPMIGRREEIVELAKRTVGASPVEVGMASWNQTVIDAKDVFTIWPYFSGLFVTSVHPMLIDPSGAPLPKCQECGQQKVKWSRVRREISQYSLSIEHWDGSDIFLIEGGDQYIGVCVTDQFLAEASELGFTNVELLPLRFF